MAIIELDPRFPTAVPLQAAGLLAGEVSYTEEVPIRVRWAIADAGGHSVSDAEVLVTTDPDNEEVRARVERGEPRIAVEFAEGAGADPAPAAQEPPQPVVDPADPLGENAPPLPRLAEAVELMARARRRGEWEAGRTHRNLLPHLIEETHEFIDAVEDGGDILGELSDLLLQVLFHAEIAEGFDIEDVADAFVAKLRRRAPYLFEAGEGQVPVAEQERAWAAGRVGPRAEPARGLPALALAEEVIRRARAAGLSDSDIPNELLCPTPGLELDDGAEARTRHAARAFLATLEPAGEEDPAADEPAADDPVADDPADAGEAGGPGAAAEPAGGARRVVAAEPLDEPLVDAAAREFGPEPAGDRWAAGGAGAAEDAEEAEDAEAAGYESAGVADAAVDDAWAAAGPGAAAPGPERD